MLPLGYIDDGLSATKLSVFDQATAEYYRSPVVCQRRDGEEVAARERVQSSTHYIALFLGSTSGRTDG
jgi:hypothetical protein